MDPLNLFYSIVQFSPFPERFEYVNAGVVIFDPKVKKTSIKLSDDFLRAKKFFGEINSIFVRNALHDFSQRVMYHFSSIEVNSSSIDAFNNRRSTLFRLTPPNAVAGIRVESALDRLFEELVSPNNLPKKIDRINTRLTRAFREAGVLSLLDKRPEPINLDQYGVSLQADYGYQNGVYNLIDAARFDSPQRGLAEAGKRVLEGKALSEMLGKRLVVVGEFGHQPEHFVDHLRSDFESVGAKLFKLDEIEKLTDEIRKTAH